MVDRLRLVVISISMIAILGATAFHANCFGADLPFLIARQPETVQEAWRTVDELVRENATLEQSLPDPLFARADLWAAVGNHEEALDDYLQATKFFFGTRPSLVEQSRALNRLSDALERLSKRPRSEYPYEADDAFWLGVNSFEKKQLEVAAAFFAEATRLMPSDAVYRAYRGLTLKRLGRTSDAERQLSVAASILRRPHCRPREQSGFHIRLERIQGPERQWVQQSVNAPLSATSLPHHEAAHWLRSQRSLVR